MATQNDDLDLQTFQIYHEDEEEVKAAQEKAAAEAEEAANKKGGKGSKGKAQEKKGLAALFSFGKKEEKKGQAAPTKGNKKVANPPAPVAKPKPVKKAAKSGMNDATKGILIGFVILGVFIALDQLGFLKF